MIKNHKQSEGADHPDYALASATVSWQGTLEFVIGKAYSPSEVTGYSIQDAVKHRTKIDEFSWQFFERAGDPVELVAVEPLRKFSRSEFQRVKILWRRHQRMLKKYGKRKTRRNW
jgi:hypothetical protein